MTPGALRAATGSTLVNAQRYAPHLTEACDAYGIDTPTRLAPFLAHIGHESRGLSSVVESLNYSVDALLANFGRHRISLWQAVRFGRAAGRPADQEAIANALYGGDWGRKNLGNTEPGDGWRYRGRGLKQITGRANYRRATEGIRRHISTAPDFEVTPDALQLDKWAAWSAANFWHDIDGNRFADRDDFEGLTRAINGGLFGLEDRQRRLAMAREALGRTA